VACHGRTRDEFQRLDVVLVRQGFQDSRTATVVSGFVTCGASVLSFAKHFLSRCAVWTGLAGCHTLPFALLQRAPDNPNSHSSSVAADASCSLAANVLSLAGSLTSPDSVNGSRFCVLRPLSNARLLRFEKARCLAEVTSLLSPALSRASAISFSKPRFRLIPSGTDICFDRVWSCLILEERT
jgi:hypothetical protein